MKRYPFALAVRECAVARFSWIQDRRSHCQTFVHLPYIHAWQCERRRIWLKFILHFTPLTSRMVESFYSPAAGQGLKSGVRGNCMCGTLSKYIQEIATSIDLVKWFRFSQVLPPNWKKILNSWGAICGSPGEGLVFTTLPRCSGSSLPMEPFETFRTTFRSVQKHGWAVRILLSLIRLS